jgi:hypothetical protein
MIASRTSDVTEALRANPAALSRLTALPPSHRSEYLQWITAVGRSGRFRTDWTERKESDEAKRGETRARRIAGMIERLMKTESTYGQA